MPSTPRAKASQLARYKTAAEEGVDGDAVLLHMARSWKRAKGHEKWQKGVELLPYLKPKLKAVDITQTANVKVNITIGGDDADNDG